MLRANPAIMGMIIQAKRNGYIILTHMAGIVRSNIVKYLSVLRELGYVERIVPATVRCPEQSRRGRYVIIDPYLRFYFRFLAPNLGFIERGMINQTMDHPLRLLCPPGIHCCRPKHRCSLPGPVGCLAGGRG
jgi:AAA+ ATPase superfamily predicted ATPase